MRAKAIKFLTFDEVSRLFSVIKDKRDRALFLISYRHGLRASEVGMLTKSDFNGKARRIMLHRLKGSLSGEHSMEADEVRILKAYLEERRNGGDALFSSNRSGPISRKTLDYLMRRYGEQAGLPKDKQHFHVLKHSIATHLWEKSGDLRFVQDWLGHANIQSTVIYTTLVSSVRDEKARLHFKKLPQF